MIRKDIKSPETAIEDTYFYETFTFCKHVYSKKCRSFRHFLHQKVNLYHLRCLIGIKRPFRTKLKFVRRGKDVMQNSSFKNSFLSFLNRQHSVVKYTTAPAVGDQMMAVRWLVVTRAISGTTGTYSLNCHFWQNLNFCICDKKCMKILFHSKSSGNFPLNDLELLQILT